MHKMDFNEAFNTDWSTSIELCRKNSDATLMGALHWNAILNKQLKWQSLRILRMWVTYKRVKFELINNSQLMDCG